MLRTLLAHADQDPQTGALQRDGGQAFVSLSLRPFLVSALLDADPAAPALVVAGDDRAARDLAAGLRAWLAPRPVRYYPSRGVTYESHLAPPAHLVGLRIAALDALLDPPGEGGAPVVVVSAVALSEKVPDPALRPHGFTLRVGELMDLEETATDLVAAGYERVDQVEDRGQFAIRGGLLDLFPATEDRAVRVDLFGDEIESLRWFSTFTQRSLGDASEVEIAPAAELAAEHRELAEMAALEAERPDIAELLPVEDFHAFLSLAPDGPRSSSSARRTCRRRWPTTGRTSAPPFTPPTRTGSTSTRTRSPPRSPTAPGSGCRASTPISRSSSAPRRPIWPPGTSTAPSRSSRSSPARATGRWSRSPAGATGSGRRTTWAGSRSPGCGEAEPPAGGLTFAAARLATGFIAPQFHLAVIPDHQLLRRRRETSAPRPGRRAACCAASPTCAPGTSSSTRTTASPGSPASTPRRWPG